MYETVILHEEKKRVIKLSFVLLSLAVLVQASEETKRGLLLTNPHPPQYVRTNVNV